MGGCFLEGLGQGIDKTLVWLAAIPSTLLTSAVLLLFRQLDWRDKYVLLLHAPLHSIIHCPGIVLLKTFDNPSVSIPNICPLLFADPTF